MLHQACQRSLPQENGSHNHDLHGRLGAVRAEIDLIETQLASFMSADMKGARAIIRARSKRRQFFGEDLFSDPAWDILLELYACAVAQQRIPVSKLAFVIEVPTTTVLRWVAVLAGRQLIVRTPDPTDRRRVWVSLSDVGKRKLDDYFAAN